MNEYVHSWVTLWHIWNQDNTVSQLWPESATAALNLVSLLLVTTLLKKNNRGKKGLKVLKTGHICLCLSKTAFCVCPVCSEYGHVATPSCKGSVKQIFILVFTSALVKLQKKKKKRWFWSKAWSQVPDGEDKPERMPSLCCIFETKTTL